MNLIKRIPQVFQQLKLALQLLVNNDPLRLAASTAFFASFALPFILIILVQVLDIFFNRQTVSDALFERLSYVLGKQSIQQLVVTIRGFRGLVHSGWAIAAGSLFMVFVATTLFRVIRNSFNQLWMLRIVPEKKLRTSMTGRLQSLLLILFTGLLFVAGGVLESMQALFGTYINEVIPGSRIFFNGILSLLISISITTLWFTLLIHFIPDGQSTWKISFAGAFVTAILFAVGKFVLKKILIDSDIDKIFGPAGAFVLLLLFVFYTSMIMYYGVAFTKVWADWKNKPIKPLAHAKHYVWVDE